MSSTELLNGRIDTSDTKKPNSPQYKLRNPQRKTMYVILINILADPEFSQKGEILVKINQNVVFYTKNTPIKNYSSFPIKLNVKFLDQKNLEIFAWNGTDSNLIGFDFDVKISDTPESINVSPTPLGKDVFNKVVSKPQTIIPQGDYSNQTITKLLDMEGYKKLILIITGSETESPTVVQDDFAFTNPSISVDSNLASQTGLKFGGTSFNDFIVDFGTLKSRIPKSNFNVVKIGSFNIELAVSNDDVSYSLVDSIVNPSTGDHVLAGSQQSFRYLRLRYNFVSGSVSQVSIYEMYDGLLLGGSASISFEILDDVSGQWIELISASDIGTVTTGGSISKQIGDVINDFSSNKFNAVMPSTQTNFRIKMAVVGNINVGISVIKV